MMAIAMEKPDGCVAGASVLGVCVINKAPRTKKKEPIRKAPTGYIEFEN